MDLLGLLLIGGIAAFFIFKGVLGLLEKSPPYQDGIARAQSSAEVKAALGEPIETDGMVSGNINYSNDTGSADLTVPIKGPKGTGTLHPHRHPAGRPADRPAPFPHAPGRKGAVSRFNTSPSPAQSPLPIGRFPRAGSRRFPLPAGAENVRLVRSACHDGSK